jgi:hypothetical protein
MKVNREVFEHELKIVLNEYNSKRKLKDKAVNAFLEKGFLPGDIHLIFSRGTATETLSQLMLCVLSVVLFEVVTEEYLKVKIDPTKYFTESEIEMAVNYKVEKNESKGKYPLVIENVYKLNNGQWFTSKDALEVVGWYNAQFITYNPDTQREARVKEYRDKIFTDITVNKESVKEIKEAILESRFISNFITFNILQNGNESFKYDEKNHRLIIESGELDILDGFHRSLAMIYALQENPDISYQTGIMITNFDADKAKSYIVQEDKRNKIDFKHIKSYDKENYANLIVTKINESTKSYLRGQIVSDPILIKLKKGLVEFSSLMAAVDYYFNPSDTMDVAKYSGIIIEGLNTVLETKPELFKQVADERLWITYVCAIRKVFEQDEWQDKLINVINSLPEVDINNIQYNRLGKRIMGKINDIITKVGGVNV